MTRILVTWLLFFSLVGLACAAPGTTATASPTATPLPFSTMTPEPSPTMTPTLTPSPTPVKTCRVQTGYPAGFLNLRAGPGSSYAVIAVLVEGDQLTVNQSGAWSEVTNGDMTGWIYSRYLNCEDTP